MNSATSQVAKIFMHEDYDNLLNDICLIKLKVNFNTLLFNFANHWSLVIKHILL